MECSTTPILADLFPIFGGFDIQGQRKEASVCQEKLFSLWEEVVKQRRSSASGLDDHLRKGDFLEFMLDNGFLDVQINYMLLEIFPAGTGTLTTTIEWAMAELLKNKEAMEKLCEELNREKMNSNTIKESNLSQLQYLNACIKETLRLHPPIAFLPHYAQETCEVMGYTIPKNTLVFVNLWAMGHDPTLWDDPLAFKPERFLGSNLDYKGLDFEFIPFGAGRRMCPGLPFASKQVHLILAALISCFQWRHWNGGDDQEVKMDMNEEYAVPLRKERPLLIIPNRKC